MAVYRRGSNGKGNPPSTDSRPTYQLPILCNRRDRFCQWCGGQVRFGSDACFRDDCLKAVGIVEPPTPEGWSLCPRCAVGYIEDGWRFCRLCHFRTPAGDAWQKAKTSMIRRIAEIKEEFRQGLYAIPQHPLAPANAEAIANGGLNDAQQLNVHQANSPQGIQPPHPVNEAAPVVNGDFDEEMNDEAFLAVNLDSD